MTVLPGALRIEQSSAPRSLALAAMLTLEGTS
jgi:hypothetical protein